MKKWLILSALLFSSLYALPLGNPMDASLYRNGLFCGGYDNCCDPCFSWCNAWSFRIGFYGDYVFQRSMELDNRDHADIDDTEIFTNAGYLALNFCDRLDIFATLGATNIEIEANPKVFGNGNVNNFINIVSETDFSWSIGGRLTIWNCDCFFFGVEGQYFYTKPDVHRVIIPGSIAVYPEDIEMKYTEWQVGIGVSYLYRVGCSGIAAVPYLGVKWAKSKLDFDDGRPDANTTLFGLEAKKLWGWATGVTVMFCDAIGLTVEGRWGDEKAVHVNGQLRF